MPAHSGWPAVRALAASAGLVALLAGAAGARAVASRADADRFQQKIASIVTHGLAEHREPRTTRLSEGELNAYLQFNATAEIPAGVVEPTVRIEPAGRLHGRAVVDLDQVRDAKPRGRFSVWQFISGRVPVEAAGTLRTAEGVGRFELERAMVAGFPVPKTLLQEIVSYYSRRPDSPAGINLDDPFALPARILEITTDQGQATVVQ